MEMRTRWLVVLLAVGAWAWSAPSASAHHFIGTCAEVGEWTPAASAQLGEHDQTMGAQVWVGHMPPAADCVGDGVFRPMNFATQHTSLHARRYFPDVVHCLETVAQRFTDGLLRMYGYNCQGPQANIQDITNYGSSWMYLWMTSSGTYDWGHWYYRYDTNQWIYLGQTHSPCCRYYDAWLESSGYNESSVRGTLFRGFQETRQNGSTGTSNFPCPTVEDRDAHQEETSSSGGYAANTDWLPNAGNIC